MLETIAGLFPPVLFIVMHVLEALVPARRQKFSLRWRVQGFIMFAAGGAIVNGLPSLWKDAVAGRSLLSLADLPAPIGALLSILVGSFIGYWWHRARHRVPFLWRFHQMHHSAERLDQGGAFLFHPFETLCVAVLFSVPGLILGVSKEAALLAGMMGFFNACFQHANIRTPRWLGYIIQRPESHSVHHARGVHEFNYTDIPLMDMLFGTFRNPAVHEESVGFYDGASKKLTPLLLGLDVTEPETPALSTRAA